jgi:hypothetical protein
MVQIEVAPALMATFPVGLAAPPAVTWTDKRSACSWPTMTLAADSVS